MRHSQKTNLSLIQSTNFSAICARSHFQLLAIAAEKISHTRAFFVVVASTLQKNENTASRAAACMLLFSSGVWRWCAAPAADETDVQRVHEGGGTQYRFSLRVRFAR
jgi:hypothetical protein